MAFLKVFSVLALTVQPIVPSGPIFPVAAITIGVFCLLREIELSAIVMSSVCFNDLNKTVTIDLPASKTDVKGRGAKRTWGCLCKGEAPEPCPYCAARAVFEWHVSVGSLPDAIFF